MKSTYLQDKRAALARGEPWPPPSDDEPPKGRHDWQRRQLGVVPVWVCQRCGARSLDEQQPRPGGCPGRNRS